MVSQAIYLSTQNNIIIKIKTFRVTRVSLDPFIIASLLGLPGKKEIDLSFGDFDKATGVLGANNENIIESPNELRMYDLSFLLEAQRLPKHVVSNLDGSTDHEMKSKTRMNQRL